MHKESGTATCILAQRPFIRLIRLTISAWSNFIKFRELERLTVIFMKLINIGFGNIVSANRIISIISPDSAPIRRIIQESKESGMLIDATCGRRTRAVIVADSDHIILSAIQPETIASRIGGGNNE